MSAPIQTERVTIIPANEASWDDLAAVFGTTDAGRCMCQRFKVVGWIWRDSTQDGRTRGARALEAYPMITHPGKVITWGELHVGARQVFEDAGYTEVTHPTPRRVVMRVDFEYVPPGPTDRAA